MSQSLRCLAYGNLAQLADAIEDGRLAPPFIGFSVGRHTPAELSNQVAKELMRLYESGMKASHLTYLLRVLAEEKVASQNVDRDVQLVWSGPEVPGAQSRDTAVVVEELFSTAEESVLVAGFAVAQGKRIFKTLSDRMSKRSGLHVRMFLNVPRPHRDLTPESELLKRFADNFREKEWPGRRFPNVYYDRRALALSHSRRASLHAKCVVIDKRKTFVTSANFTEAAQLRNIEAGVLITDTVFARSVIGQFEALIGNGLLCQAPGMY